VGNPADTVEQAITALVRAGAGGELNLPIFSMTEEERDAWDIAHLDLLPHLAGDYRWADDTFQAGDPFRSGHWTRDRFEELRAAGAIVNFDPAERALYVQYRVTRAVVTSYRDRLDTFLATLPRADSSTGAYTTRSLTANAFEPDGPYGQLTAAHAGIEGPAELVDLPLRDFYQQVRDQAEEVPGYQRYAAAAAAGFQARSSYENEMAAAEPRLHALFDYINGEMDAIEDEAVPLPAEVIATAREQVRAKIIAVTTQYPQLGYTLTFVSDTGHATDIRVSLLEHYRRYYERTFGAIDDG